MLFAKYFGKNTGHYAIGHNEHDIFTGVATTLATMLMNDLNCGYFFEMLNKLTRGRTSSEDLWLSFCCHLPSFGRL
jgi:hypothetical protein